MLRLSLLALLIANAGYLAWSQGWMATLGWAPEVQSEPHRLLQQVRPDVLRIVPPPAPEAVTAAIHTPPPPTEPVEEILPEVTVCLQSDALDEAHFQALKPELQASDLPPSSWAFAPIAVNGRWMVYLGKFANEMALEKRRAELRTRKISYDRAGGSLELGLSLGRFASEEAATRELSHMVGQGVRGARVVQERAPHTLYQLRLENATAAQRQILQALQPALQGKTMLPCTTPSRP